MKRLGCVLAVPALVLAFFTLLVSPHIFGPPLLLLFGWAFAINRLIQAWHPSAPAVVLFTAGLLALVFGSHAFMRWLFGNMQRPAGEARESSQPWRLKWTVCGYGILFCALLAIATFVLTTHQIYWISRSEEPWFIDARTKFMTFIVVRNNLQREAETNHWDPAKTRAAFWKMEAVRDRSPAWETLQTVWLEKDPATLQAILLVPRQLSARGTTRFAIIQPGQNFNTQDLDRLPEVIASFASGKDARSEDKPAPMPP
jgi:hypothetical protein